MINILNNFQSPTVLAKKKIENMQIFERFIKQIYQKNVANRQLSEVIRTLQMDFGYGALYSVIRQSLQNACKCHRSIISSSASSLAKRIHSFYKINNSPGSPQSEEANNIKFLQMMVNIIYYHFNNLAQSNQQVCDLWDMIKAKTSSTKNYNDFNIRTPELKLSILNLLALKELIPPCQHVSLSDFRAILEMLNNSKEIVYKQNIQKLLDVYKRSDATADNPPALNSAPLVELEKQKQVQRQKQKQKQKQRQKQKQQQQQKEKEKELEKQKQKQRQKQKQKQKERQKQKEKQKEKIIGKQKLDKGMLICGIDETNWLQKAKQNPIAKKLCERLGGMFCKDQDKKISIGSQTSPMDILTQKLFDMGPGEQPLPFRVIRTSTILKCVEQLKQFDFMGQQEPGEFLDEMESISRKKKRKNKNKKKKQKAQQQEEEMGNKKAQNIGEVKQMVNQNDMEDYLQTIKFLKQLKIDDSKRANCVVEKKKIQDWRRIVQFS